MGTHWSEVFDHQVGRLKKTLPKACPFQLWIMILVQCSRNTISINCEKSLLVQILGLKIYLDVEKSF